MLGYALPGASAWEEATEFAERSGLLAIPCLRELQAESLMEDLRHRLLGEREPKSG
jgi:hypothetical protein